ncbi:transposase [Fragilaria crotonensis]|nr:transposase [Fragilaria crotonensis]
MKDYVVPPMTPSAKNEFHKVIAMHFYMTGQSFYRMEEMHLIEALRQLRPDVTLPSRKDLRGKLLNHAYNEVKQKVDGWLDRGAYGSLTTDGWSNIKNESVVNYMFVSGADGMSVFLESIETGAESHTAEFLANNIKRVIESAPPNAKIAGVVMDNTSANKAAWRLLQDSYPSRFFQGCVAHALHLLVKDVFAATKARRGRDVSAYPENYPFEPLLTFISQVKKMVGYFHQHHVPRALLKSALKERNLRTLASAAATRGGSIGEMMKTCLAAEAVLYFVTNTS